jgi:dinuclear metal center YbgI/SA1388 family protein
MKLADALAVLEGLAPLRYAESWDNVGLLVGDPATEVSRVLVTVDYTPEVAEEAIAARADLVVAYHPPMFAAVKRARHDALWVDAIRRGIALYSMHTALDVASGGTNDVLAEACGGAEVGRRALRAYAPKDAHVKLVVFVPEADLEGVSEAMFEAGAGRIGAYTRCSFRIPGTGTFFGEEGTNPTVGERGKLETVDEIRLETLVPIARLEGVVAAMRRAHSYEEPAFDLVRLAPPPVRVGQGRVADVTETTLGELVSRLKTALGVRGLLVAGKLDASVRRVAVAAGAGGELLEDAIRASADVFVTGEIRHHDALSAVRRGVAVIATLHSNSERAAVRSFAAKLEGKLGGVEVRTSNRDADPFDVV